MRRAARIGSRRLGGPRSLVHVDRHRRSAFRQRHPRQADHIRPDLRDRVTVHLEGSVVAGIAEIPAGGGICPAEDHIPHQLADVEGVVLAMGGVVDDRALTVHAASAHDDRRHAHIHSLVADRIGGDIQRRAVLDHHPRSAVGEHTAHAQPRRSLRDHEIAGEVWRRRHDIHQSGSPLLQRAGTVKRHTQGGIGIRRKPERPAAQRQRTRIVDPGGEDDRPLAKGCDLKRRLTVIRQFCVQSQLRSRVIRAQGDRAPNAGHRPLPNRVADDQVTRAGQDTDRACLEELVGAHCQCRLGRSVLHQHGDRHRVGGQYVERVRRRSDRLDADVGRTVVGDHRAASRNIGVIRGRRKGDNG